MEESLMMGSRSRMILEQTKGRFRKEFIHVGEYTYPGDSERIITITPERLQNWVQAFKESGVKVWVPLGHTRAPQENAGWVIDMFVENDSLIGIIEISDPEVVEKLRQGSIADVSIGVEYDFIDYQGRSWPEIIRHVALTVDPHIRDQEGFLEIDTAELDKIGQDGGGAAASGNMIEIISGGGVIPKTLPPDSGLIPDKELVPDEESVPGQETPQKQIPPKRGRPHKKPSDEERHGGESHREGIGRAKEVELQMGESGHKTQCACRAEIAQEVENWILQGKITPAVRSRVEYLLEATDAHQVHFEGGNYNLANLIRSVIADLPILNLGASRLTRFNLSEPHRGTISDSERELLTKLGISEEVYLKYRN